MRHTLNHWRLKLCIEEVHLSLTRAAQAAFGFFTVSARQKVFILQRHSPLEYITVDRETYHASRGTVRFAACQIIFYGGPLELTQLAAAVPPSLFPVDSPTPGQSSHQPKKGDI